MYIFFIDIRFVLNNYKFQLKVNNMYDVRLQFINLLKLLDRYFFHTVGFICHHVLQKRFNKIDYFADKIYKRNRKKLITIYEKNCNDLFKRNNYLT